MDAALVGVAAYAAIQELLRRPAMHIFGEDVECGGTPCWRACLVLFPQLVALPLATVIAVTGRPSWRQLGERAAIYIFQAFLIIDIMYNWIMYPKPVLRRLMVIHHVVCVFGHLYGTSMCPKLSVPYFLCATCVLEIGSGSCNIFHIWRYTEHEPIAYWTYAVVMTLSNAGATYIPVEWNRRAREGGAHWLGRWVPMALWSALIYMRQVEVIDPVA